MEGPSVHWQFLSVEVERLKHRTGEEKGQSPCGVGLGDALQLHQNDIAGVMQVLRNQERVQFEGCVAELFHTITAIMPGSNLSCFLLRLVLHDALSEITHNFTRR